jgi:hypothetical protein
MRKLQACSLVDLIKRAMAMGLIEEPDGCPAPQAEVEADDRPDE